MLLQVLLDGLGRRPTHTPDRGQFLHAGLPDRGNGAEGLEQLSFPLGPNPRGAVEDVGIQVQQMKMEK